MPSPRPTPAVDRLVQQATRFLRHAEPAGAERFVHVFRRRARERDLEVVNQAGAVGRERGHEPAPHQVHEDGREARLDHVRAEAPDDAAVLALRALEARDDGLEVRAREDVRQPIDPRADAAALLVRPREVLDAGLALARRQRIGPHAGQVELFVGKGTGTYYSDERRAMAQVPGFQVPRFQSSRFRPLRVRAPAPELWNPEPGTLNLKNRASRRRSCRTDIPPSPRPGTRRAPARGRRTRRRARAATTAAGGSSSGVRPGPGSEIRGK